MALDDIILEPIAKGYNKLPMPVKKGTSNFTQTLELCYQYQITFYKVIFNKSVIQ